MNLSMKYFYWIYNSGERKEKKIILLKKYRDKELGKMKEKKIYYYLVRDFREIREGEGRSMGRGIAKGNGKKWTILRFRNINSVYGIYLIIDYFRYVRSNFSRINIV